MSSYVYDRVKQIVSQLYILKRNIKPDIIDMNKARAEQQITDIILLVMEAHYQCKTNNLDMLVELIEMQVEKLKKAKDKEALEKIIERVVAFFAEERYKKELSSSRTVYSFRRALNENDNLNKIVNQIKNERRLNVLSYDAPIEMLNKKDIQNERINSYGILVESHSYTGVVQNIAYGSGGNSNISNNAFDILLLAPQSHVHYEPIGFRGDIIPKGEYLNIVSSLGYLRAKGLICIQLAYTRLEHDLCVYLARNFEDVRVTKINEILIEVTGIKKTEKMFSEEDYSTLRNVYKNMKELPVFSDYKYELPKDMAVIANFRGSRITKEMLANAREKTSAFSEVVAVSTHVDDLANHKPLLPFNTGQIGLILASGCLDGIVEEDENNCHLIKGRVERIVDTKKGKRGADDTIMTYHSVKINALTPQGKLIQIS